MATNKNYSITLSSILDTSGIEKQIKALEAKKHNITFTTGGKAVNNTTKSFEGLNKAINQQDKSLQNNLLTFQAANMLLSRTVDIISSMTEQVLELNKSVIEYQKVTDLSGESLDKYVDKLSVMGRQVARTGSEMVDAATEFRKNSYSDADSASLALVAT